MAANFRSERAIVTIALGICTACCLGAAPPSAPWEPIPAQAWQETARPDSGGAEAIMLLERTECRQEESKFEMDYFARAKVFTPEGRAIANIEVEYLKKVWKLSNLRARTVRPSGETVELDPSTIVTTTAFKYRDYEWLKASVAVPGVEPGCIVEWGYTLSGPSGYWNGWQFRFSNHYYTCLTSQVWRASTKSWEGVHPVWRYSAIPPGRVEEICEPNKDLPTSITFNVRRLSGVHDELFSPPAVDAAPRVDIHVESINAEPWGFWSRWKSLFDQYQKEINKAPGGLTALVADFRKGAADDEGALRAAFLWVQTHMVSNEELPWARRPEADKIQSSYAYSKSMDQLLERTEASPLEINTLMVALARKLGLQASVGMVGDRRFRKFDTRVLGFPPGNFITVVVLPNETIFLQPSSRFAPFRSIPWNLRGGECLLSGESRSLICRVPPEVGLPARSEWSVDLDLAPTGALDGRIEARLSGEEAADWKRELWDEAPDRWKPYLEERLAANDGPRAVFDVPSLGSPADTQLVLRATAKWPGISTADGDRIEVPVERLVPWRTAAHFVLERRTQPILMHYAKDEKVRVKLRLPAGMTLDELPAPAECTNPLGSWSQRWSYTDGVASVERQVTIQLAEVPQRQYPLVREFFDSLERADQTVLLVVKGK